MAIVLKCGFEMIKLDLRESLIQKARLLFESGHVLDVQETRDISKDENQDPNTMIRNDRLTLICGHVLPQTSISKTPYRVILEVNKDRQVMNTRCDCKAGQGKCKHVAALIVAVNEEDTVSCTSGPQAWGKPSTVMKNKYKKGRRMEEMFPQKYLWPEITCKPPTVSNLDGLGALSLILRAEGNNNINRDCNDVLSFIVKTVEKQCDHDDMVFCCSQIFQRQSQERPFIFNSATMGGHLQIKNGPKLISLHPRVAQFYNERICISQSDATQLCINTSTQSECPLWHEERRLRIPSSKIHRVKTRRKDYAGLADQLLTSKPFFSAATQYGIKMEETARREYCKIYDVRVIQVGLVICVPQPFLCCSPDGIILNGADVELLEIKCPYTLQYKMLVNWDSKESYVPYLTFVNNVLKLKTSHSYYSQIQFSLYINRADKCHLFIYSKCQTVRVCVVKDDVFLCEYIAKVEDFYFGNYLIALAVNKCT